MMTSYIYVYKHLVAMHTQCNQLSACPQLQEWVLFAFPEVLPFHQKVAPQWHSPPLFVDQFFYSVSSSFFCTNKKIQKEVCWMDGDDEETSSGSLSHIVAQEDDVVCGKNAKQEERSFKVMRRERMCLRVCLIWPAMMVVAWRLTWFLSTYSP